MRNDRAVLGALVFVGMNLMHHDYMTVAMQAAFSAALLALLIGNAGTARIIVACSLLAVCLAAECIGLVMMMGQS